MIIIFDSGGKICMQYFVSNTDPDIVGGTRVTMGVTLAASDRG